MALTSFATGLYSANSLGTTFLSGLVTVANFRGLPIVGAFRGIGTLSSSNAALLLLTDFAASFNAPLVVVDDNASTAAYTYLRSACNTAGPLFDSAKSQRPVCPTSASTMTPVIFSGPFVAVGTTEPTRTAGVEWSWETAAGFSRTSEYHPYGLGMQGVSWFTSSNLGPPVFVVGAGAGGVGEDLKKLQKIWQAKAVTTTSQYQTLLEANADRPGLARLCNAALVPYIVLEVP